MIFFLTFVFKNHFHKLLICNTARYNFFQRGSFINTSRLQKSFRENLKENFQGKSREKRQQDFNHYSVNVNSRFSNKYGIRLKIVDRNRHLVDNVH